MKIDNSSLKNQPVVTREEDFDPSSGSFIERLFFNHRKVAVLICLLLTVGFLFSATRLRVNAGFMKMIPLNHPFITNYLQNQENLRGVGNSLQVAVETTQGTIIDKNYLETLRKINDELFFIPGVDRVAMKSLWTSSTRWHAVTEQGFIGGTVLPDTYDGSPAAMEQVRLNIERSGTIGKLVASNFKSSVVFLPLMDVDPNTGAPLDYQKLSDQLEKVRQKYQKDGIKIHITGFAKVAGDLLDGLRWFVVFFALAILIDGGLRMAYVRCWRSMSLLVGCSLVAVVWLLGMLPILGYELDPYSVLIPFLVFSIGMSHGSQKMNGILQDIGRGTHKVVAARYTFRRLFLAGLTALLADAVGFAVLMTIHIQVIRDLAIASSIGVAILIFTNLILLPILLGFTGVSPTAAARSLREDEASGKSAAWAFLDLFTRRKWASVALLVSAGLLVVGFIGRGHLKIGDLDPGAPELRPNSRYNLDSAFMNANYAASSDVLVVMVKTGDYKAAEYANLLRIDALEEVLCELPGVRSTSSLASFSKGSLVGYNEGSPKWYEVQRNDFMLKEVSSHISTDIKSEIGDLVPVYVYLKDHKADTLDAVVGVVDAFAKANDTPAQKFLLAAGNGGIEAATNIVVKKAIHDTLWYIYGAVILLCYITFRSWRAVVVAVIPLVITSVLCEALMAWMGIGVKVATLPVVALGVGIGVDYALYILSVVLARLREGSSLSEAYYATLCFTGRVVLLTGLTLAFGVATWVFAPIKFQADMGLLLVFMFLWNMVGALVLLPALACFLLKPTESALEGVGVRETATLGSVNS
jgi:predicted RND superfamily exporter protein